MKKMYLYQDDQLKPIQEEPKKWFMVYYDKFPCATEAIYFLTIEDRNAYDYRIVRQFLKNNPSVTKRIIKDSYRISEPMVYEVTNIIQATAQELLEYCNVCFDGEVKFVNKTTAIVTIYKD